MVALTFYLLFVSRPFFFFLGNWGWGIRIYAYIHFSGVSGITTRLCLQSRFDPFHASILVQDGLTPLDLCLYSGHDTHTYELIKLLKLLPKPR